MSNDNSLIYTEKPYMTLEERIMHARIAIKVAEEHGDYQTANHYRILLDLYERKEEDELTNNYINRIKK